MLVSCFSGLSLCFKCVGVDNEKKQEAQGSGTTKGNSELAKEAT